MSGRALSLCWELGGEKTLSLGGDTQFHPPPLPLAGKGPDTLSGPSAGGGDTWGSPGSHNLASASDLGVSGKKATSMMTGHLLYSESSGIVQFTRRTSFRFLFSPSFTEEKVP